MSPPKSHYITEKAYFNNGVRLEALAFNAPEEPRPFHKSFTFFPRLPAELRRAIWQLSLEPRVVDILHRRSGFISDTDLPAALMVHKESRDTVIKSYPLCFGNILREPNVRFNFELDTLFLHHDMTSALTYFLACLEGLGELDHIRYMAVSAHMGFDIKSDDKEAIDPTDCWDDILTTVDNMPALKECTIVYDVLRYYTCDPKFARGVPAWKHLHTGEGPMYLFEELPPLLKLQIEDLKKVDLLIMQNGEPVPELPCQVPDLNKHPMRTDIKWLDVPKITSAWGWRPGTYWNDNWCGHSDGDDSDWYHSDGGHSDGDHSDGYTDGYSDRYSDGDSDGDDDGDDE